MATWKEKYNKKYGFEKDKSHSLNEIAKTTGVSKKGIQQIYNKGIGAWKTNLPSVRLKGSFKKNKNTKKFPRSSRIGKQQWAMARVYSAVSGGKASKVDAKELKMEMGGKTESFDRVSFYKDYYQRLSPSNFIVETDNSNIIIDMEMAKGGKLDKSLTDKIEILKDEGYPQKQAIAIAYDMQKRGKFATGGVTTAIVTDPNEAMADLQSTYGFKDVFKEGGKTYDYDSYTTFDEEKSTNEYNGVQYILNGEYILVARSLYMRDKELFNYYKYLQRLNITLEDCQKFALSINKVFEEMVCNIKVLQKKEGKRSLARLSISPYSSFDAISSYYGVENIDGIKSMISTTVEMVCCKGKFLERLSGKPIPANDLKNYYSFQTLIHELAHCLDFQYQFKQGKIPVVAHKDYFLNALYKIIQACKDGKLPLAKNFGIRAKGLKRASILLDGKI